ncbi:MAG: hypothetical protein O3C43_17520 [Verrucomicrobia bacterium]|nr:hypothetical protein [Verrucomicrobiota bacterium]MDA1068291.1 hypothetical protein [Verrucomicrobiota bacterium]
METDSNNEVMSSVKDESSSGWTRLYIIVVAALVAQIAFYAWLTKTFE